jgi:acetylornithine deacetylase/succinyl-diaminopimelate desuccinylase-like protein
MKRYVLSIALFTIAAFGQNNPAAQVARRWRLQHERAILDEFFSLLSIPNLAGDRANIQRNAETIAKMMERRGIAPRLISVPSANPVVFGEIRTPGAARTIVFYAHYDGQPLNEKEWATPPFAPVLRSRSLEQDGQVITLPAPGAPFDPQSRIYARSASDDKANIITILNALDAVRSAKLNLKSNLKFVFEGEEEVGSVNLENILAANKALFSGDVWLMCDGPVHQTGRPLIYFGVRGDLTVDITLYGARNELHSGHYGNWAPNPAMMMAKLLASMKDDQGHVTVDHFYDGIEPLGATEKRALAEAPDIDLELMRQMWLGSTEGAPKRLLELITEPSLSIRGMASSRTGDHASNVIPATATASIDIRLVKGMDHRQTVERLIDHVRRQGYFVVDAEPNGEVRRAHARVAKLTIGNFAYNAARTPMDLPISKEVILAVESARGPTVKLPTSGASLPLDMIERVLGTRTIYIPIANHDNNQHSFNENLRVQNLWDGIELMAALLTM